VGRAWIAGIRCVGALPRWPMPQKPEDGVSFSTKAAGSPGRFAGLKLGAPAMAVHDGRGPRPLLLAHVPMTGMSMTEGKSC